MSMSFVQNKIFRRIGIALLAVLILLLFPLSWAMGRGSVPIGASKDAICEVVRITHAHTRASVERERAYFAAFAEVGEGDAPYVSGDAVVEVISVTEDALSFAVTDVAEDLSPYGRTVYYNLDPVTGRHLTLGDVLGEGWRERVTEALLPMIAADCDTYNGVDVYPMINDDRMFLIKADGGIEIVFDGGEIAPDAAGIKKYPVDVGE